MTIRIEYWANGEELGYFVYDCSGPSPAFAYGVSPGMVIAGYFDVETRVYRNDDTEPEVIAGDWIQPRIIFAEKFTKEKC